MKKEARVRRAVYEVSELSEQLGAGRREGDESSGFVHLQPAALDREFKAGAVLGRAGAVTEQKRLVDFLDVDAALGSEP